MKFKLVVVIRDDETRNDRLNGVIHQASEMALNMRVREVPESTPGKKGLVITLWPLMKEEADHLMMVNKQRGGYATIE